MQTPTKRRKIGRGMTKKAQANFIKMVESGHRGPFSLTTGKKINLGTANAPKPQ